MSTEDRSAGRWCAVCAQHGSHHTDKHAEFVPTTPTPAAPSRRAEVNGDGE